MKIFIRVLAVFFMLYYLSLITTLTGVLTLRNGISININSFIEFIFFVVTIIGTILIIIGFFKKTPYSIKTFFKKIGSIYLLTILLYFVSVWLLSLSDMKVVGRVGRTVYVIADTNNDPSNLRVFIALTLASLLSSAFSILISWLDEFDAYREYCNRK